MHVEKPGPVTDRITLLGRRESCVYLLDGQDEAVILGGGMTCVAPDLFSQIQAFGIDPEKIRRLIIHHSHFDHVGLVPCLKARWPWLKITASARAKAQLQRPEVVAAIVSLNRMLLPGDDRDLSACLDDCLELGAIPVDEVLADGDILSCGDLDLLALAVPGHSSCSMAVYIPQEKAMAASDAGGIPYGDRVFAAANSNFDLYQESLKKMAVYPTEVHLSEHYGALTGKAGRGFMARSMADARQMRSRVQETWDRYKDPEQTVLAMLAQMEDEAKGYFLPKEVMTLVLSQMVRFFQKKEEAK